MTYKTINLSDMCYFQPPILIKITVNPLFQFLMLPDKTWNFHSFQSKIVQKGQKYVPKPPFYSYIRYTDLPDPFG